MSAKSSRKVLTTLPRRLLSILVYLLLFRWLRDIVAWLGRVRDIRQRGKHLRDVRRGRPTHCSSRCEVIRPEVYKRPDPLIYSQSYLMEQGLGVTWDNPDIQLFRDGSPVSSSSLEPDTEYDVVATVHNNSTDAPAVGLPVEFSFLSFGVGAVETALGTTKIDLPVKGAPGHPARATHMWRTPATPGHYCLKVRLVWSDDANPKNNLGQENTNVAAASSPAVFEFPVRNEDDVTGKTFRMVADAYTVPAPPDCREVPPKKKSDRQHPEKRQRAVFVPPTEEEANWTLARVRHDVDAFGIPNGWTVEIDPSDFELDPGESLPVTVVITPPDDFRGERSFNVNAMHGAALVGGVTLTVTS